ncbi:MAG: HAD family hydrolase, partial [Spirochaetota bacterium]
MEQNQPKGRGCAKEAREVCRRGGEGADRLSTLDIEAVIFDLDGTLVDSEPNYRVVDERYLLSKGIELSDDEWEEVVGMGGAPFIDLLRNRFGIEGTTAELIAEKDDLYLEYAPGRTRAFPAITELVRYLFVHGYRLAVGTASRRRVLDRILEETGLA